jgi:hypothetical protein
MTEQATVGASAPATQRPLVYTRYPNQASWTEVFYDGTCKVVKGRIEKYKENWFVELCSNRGFSVEPEIVAESSVVAEEVPAASDAPASVATEEHALSGQEATAEPKPKRPKQVKGKN